MYAKTGASSENRVKNKLKRKGRLKNTALQYNKNIFATKQTILSLFQTASLKYRLSPRLQREKKMSIQNHHLDWLEAESIYIIREVIANAQNPALLFSGGKDSVVLLALAVKASNRGAR